jgi:uncharacterized protein YjbJ (UPF0337 family)
MGELMDKLKGKAKIAQAKLTGDDAKRGEGMVDVWKGRIKGAVEELKSAFKRGARHTEEPTHK